MRQWKIRVTPWPRLKTDHPYTVQVRNVSKKGAAKTLLVQLEFMDRQMQGRKVVLELRIVPLRPDGITAEYFKAAGLKVTPGDYIAPRKTIGSTMKVCFAAAGEDSEIRPVSFAPFDEKHIKKQSRHKANPITNNEKHQKTASEKPSTQTKDTD